MRLNAKTCPVCGDPVIGRADKKFCSDHCRATFNHDYRAAVNESIIDTNRAIQKNRTILKTLCPEGKTIVRREVLENKGYNFNLFSSIFTTPNKTVYFMCYDYGFCPITDNGKQKVLIISSQIHSRQLDPWAFSDQLANNRH